MFYSIAVGAVVVVVEEVYVEVTLFVSNGILWINSTEDQTNLLHA